MDRIARGLSYATRRRNKAEVDLALVLYDALSDQWTGRGLAHEGGGGGDDGKMTVVVSGSIDLIALARRAISAVKNSRAPK